MFMRLMRPAVSLLVLMTLLVGIVYPLVITGAARAATHFACVVCLLRNQSHASRPASASVVPIAVSFASAASEKRTAVRQ